MSALGALSVKATFYLATCIIFYMYHDKKLKYHTTSMLVALSYSGSSPIVYIII